MDRSESARREHLHALLYLIANTAAQVAIEAPAHKKGQVIAIYQAICDLVDRIDEILMPNTVRLPLQENRNSQ